MTLNPYTVRTYSGLHVDFTDPQPDQISVDDISVALSRAPRFNGHTKAFYSVAQHSYMVSLLLPETRALRGLLHDASEGYIADVPTPAKRLMPDYYRVEKVLQDKIMETFGLPPGAQADPDVVLADIAMLFYERDALLDEGLVWPNEDQHPGGSMKELFSWWEPWDSSTAQLHFLNRFNYLMSKNDNSVEAVAA